MGLTTSAIKQILLLLNFIFAILALLLIGFGIYVLVSSAENQVDHGENVAGGIIIAIGVIVLLLGIFGVLAVMHESPRQLLIYVILVVVFIFMQLLICSMASVGSKDGLSGSVDEGFKMLWEMEEKEPGALAYYEDWLHCCGVNNTEDYRRIHHFVPKSCCRAHVCTVETIYPVGCKESLEEYLTKTLRVFVVCNWILIISEIIAAVLGWIMLTRLKNEGRRANVGWM